MVEAFNLIWNKLLGGSGADLVRDVIAADDGGVVVSATTESNDGWWICDP